MSTSPHHDDDDGRDDGEPSVGALVAHHKDEIVHEWESEVRRHGIRPGDNTGAGDVAALIDHIARAVDPSFHGQHDDAVVEEDDAAPDMWNHVVTRLADGLDLGGVVAELSILRACIVRAYFHARGWHRTGRNLDEVLALHHAVDAAIDSAIDQALQVQRAFQDNADRAFAKLDALLAASPVGIAFVDLELRVRRINDAFAAIDGRPVPEHLGRRVRDLLPKDADMIEPAIGHVLETGESLLNVELSVAQAPSAPSSLVRDFLVNVFPVRTQAGELVGAGVVLAEVTDVNETKKRAERAAAELEAVIENMPAAVFIGTARQVSRANRFARDMLGIDGDDVTANGNGDITAITARTRARDVVSGERIPVDEMPYMRALRGERVVKDSVAYSAIAGGDRVVTTYAAPVPVREEEEPAAVSIVVDVTDRRRAEESARFLSEATALLSSSFDHVGLVARLVEHVVPARADWCAVDLVRDGGGLERAASAPRDREEPGRALYADRYTVPLRARDRLLGTMTFLSAESGRRFDDVDVALFSELAERTSTAVDNARLYEEARRAVRTREEVLAIVSHDLKSPLSAVSLAASLLARRVDDNARSQVETILRAGRRMERLINDLLDMASIQAGRLAVVKEPEEMPSLVKEAVEEHRAPATARGIRIDLDVDPLLDVVVVHCDRRRILQLLGNLIGNAVKFSPAGGAVGVSAARSGDDVLLRVSDRGPGIADEQRSRLFEPFWSAPEHAEKGTGLGLTIAKGIVDSHGGSIDVASTPGVGTTFTVTLPL